VQSADQAQYSDTWIHWQVLRQGSDPSVSFRNQSPKNKSYGAVSRHGHVSGIPSLRTHYKGSSVFSRNTKFQGSKMHATDFRKSCATLYYSYSAIPFFLLFMFVSFVNCIVAVFLGTSCRNSRVNRQSLRCSVYSVIALHFGPICGYVDSFET
jgi:hypothetical protein